MALEGHLNFDALLAEEEAAFLVNLKTLETKARAHTHSGGGVPARRGGRNGAARALNRPCPLPLPSPAPVPAQKREQLKRKEREEDAPVVVQRREATGAAPGSPCVRPPRSPRSCHPAPPAPPLRPHGCVCVVIPAQGGCPEPGEPCAGGLVGRDVHALC